MNLYSVIILYYIATKRNGGIRLTLQNGCQVYLEVECKEVTYRSVALTLVVTPVRYVYRIEPFPISLLDSLSPITIASASSEHGTENGIITRYH